MTPQQIETAVRHAITKVAPDADPSRLAPDADMCEALDLDSLDFLRVLTDVEHTLAVKLPASAHGRMRTLGGCVDVLSKLE